VTICSCPGALTAKRSSRAPTPPQDESEGFGGKPFALELLGHASEIVTLGGIPLCPHRCKRAPRYRDSRGASGYRDRGIGVRPQPEAPQTAQRLTVSAYPRSAASRSAAARASSMSG